MVSLFYGPFIIHYILLSNHYVIIQQQAYCEGVPVKRFKMVFKFQGNLDSILEVHKNVLSDVLQKHGFSDEVVDIQPIGKPGDNYAADVKRIVVRTDGEPFQIVAKLGSQNEGARMSNGSGILFKNEHVMYTEVLPKLVDLQITAGIPKEERFRYPICYGAYMEEPFEMILLEDLQLSNFTMMDKFESLTDVTVRMILKDFALFHSLSFVWKAKEPETFKQMTNKLTNIMTAMSTQPEANMYFVKMHTDVMSILKSDKHIKAVDGVMQNMVSILNELHKVDEDGKYSVVIQGDAWTNNIMFRLENGAPIENIMIDYQQSNKNNPVCDLLHMIFVCTDYETRSEHYFDWIDYYHTELDKSLHEFGLEANVIYPRDQLDADIKRYSKFYMSFAILASTIIMRKAEDAAAFKEAMANSGMEGALLTESLDVNKLDEDTVTKFREKTEGIIDSMYDFGYL